jgi:ABC-type nitrate/sulfonate/bicarbonate transport system substrate-binding protein
MSAKIAHEVKLLQTRIAQQQVEVDATGETARVALAKHEEGVRTLKALKERLKAMTTNTPEPLVTEHALLRYVQRMYGIDLDKVKADILTPATTAKIKALKSATLEIGPGVKIVVKDYAVVSVIAEE